jgi:glycosyltransferase involved in cell wall biosynthesis
MRRRPSLIAGPHRRREASARATPHLMDIPHTRSDLMMRRYIHKVGRPPMAQELISYSVVVPVYNSSPVLKLLHRRLVTVMEAVGGNFELILVDDGSTDGSWSVLREIACSDLHVLAIQLGQNIGQGPTTLVGLSYASGEILITLDDDLQHVPEEIPKLLGHLGDLAASGYDVVLGIPAARAHPIWRRVASWVFNVLFSAALGKPLSLRFTGFRVMRRPIVERLLALRWPDPFLSALLFQITPRIGAVLVQHPPSQLRSSRYSIRKLLRIPLGFFGAFSDRERGRCAIVAIVFGFVITAIGLVSSFVVPNNPFARPFLVVSAIFGACIVAFGLTGVAIGWRVAIFRRQAVTMAPIKRMICRRQGIGDNVE